MKVNSTISFTVLGMIEIEIAPGSNTSEVKQDKVKDQVKDLNPAFI